MNNDPHAESPAETIKGGLSRRQLLGMGALGMAGTLFSSPPASADDDRDHPSRWGRPQRLLLKGGIVLTLDEAIGDFSKGDVLIERGKIKEVGPHISYHRHRGARVIDCSGKIVMPGFVDTHRHMWQGLLRNSGPGDLLVDYVRAVLMGFALNLTPEEVYLGDLISALSAINCGITTILDWSHINKTPQHADAVIQALRDAHIRAVYAYGPNFFYQPFWFPAETVNPYPEDIYRLRSTYFNSEDQLLTLALAAAGPQFAGSVDAAVYEWLTARDVGARITTHVGVGADGPGLVAALRAALQALDQDLGPETTYIHCCTLNRSDWDAISGTGGTVSLAFPVEMQMGHGVPPIQKALELVGKERISLSVDVETNQPTDMFNQMRFCFALQRMLENEAYLFRFADVFTPPPSEPSELVALRERLLTVRDVLKFATIGGATANGLDHKIGTLTPENEADIILLDTRQINVAPINNATGAVVLGMDCGNVDSVFIAGKAVKWKGRLVGVDVDQLLRRAQRAHDALMARNGRPPFVV